MEIHEGLYRDPTAALSQGHIEAVTALDGVDKTTIARQYAEKFWHCYEQILWVSFPSGMESEFASLVDILLKEPGEEPRSVRTQSA